MSDIGVVFFGVFIILVLIFLNVSWSHMVNQDEIKDKVKNYEDMFDNEDKFK